MIIAQSMRPSLKFCCYTWCRVDVGERSLDLIVFICGSQTIRFSGRRGPIFLSIDESRFS